MCLFMLLGKDDEGNTALHILASRLGERCVSGNPETLAPATAAIIDCLKLILAVGVDAHATNLAGYTALHDLLIKTRKYV